MKGKILAGFLAIIIAYSFTGCGRTYIKESDIKTALKDHDKYIGQYIKMDGFIDASEKIGDKYVFTIVRGEGLDTFDGNCVYLYLTKRQAEEFTVGDYIRFNGKIVKPNEYAGLSIKCDEIVKDNYIKRVKPAKNTKKVNQKASFDNVDFTINKVEYAESETRLYVSITNNNARNAGVDTYSSTIMGNDGNEYYPELPPVQAYNSYGVSDLPRIKPGKTHKEIIRIPYKLDKDKSYKISTYITIYDSSNIDEVEIAF